METKMYGENGVTAGEQQVNDFLRQIRRPNEIANERAGKTALEIFATMIAMAWMGRRRRNND
jgi:hypothetical protein